MVTGIFFIYLCSVISNSKILTNAKIKVYFSKHLFICYMQCPLVGVPRHI